MDMDAKKIVKIGKKVWDQYGDKIIDTAGKVVKKKIPKENEDKEDDTAKVIEKSQEIIGEYGGIVVSAVNTLTGNKYDKAIGAASTVLGAVSKPQNTEQLVPDQEAIPSSGPDAVAIDSTSTTIVEEEDTFFEDSTAKLTNVLKDAAQSGFTDPASVMAAIGTLGEVANDTVKYVEEQETKREEVRAQRDVAIAQINATTQCIKDYLDKTFDERSSIFAKQFEAVDEALRTGNTDMLAMTLQSINALAAQSPFKNLADIGQVKQALTDGNAEWDI